MSLESSVFESNEFRKINRNISKEDKLNYKEYIAQVIAQDGEEFNIKTFALTMQEALDNIVLMPSITHVVQLHCDETDENWTRQGNLDLNDLRKVRDFITDEKELFEVLTSAENNKT